MALKNSRRMHLSYKFWPQHFNFSEGKAWQQNISSQNLSYFRCFNKVSIIFDNAIDINFSIFIYWYFQVND